jgi:uncharacterized protein (DUF488 family)
VALELYTIGVYGYEPETFFAALTEAGIDTFCDLRARRGVRGREYAFANAARLQAELERLGIRYLHLLDLAPSAAIREAQWEADRAAGIAKRQRTGLGDTFVERYRQECLAGFDTARFVESLGPEARRVVLFCVEREPEACHRSLVTGRLAEELGLPVTHLKPS